MKCFELWEYQYYPYDWRTGTVHDHPPLIERGDGGVVGKTWPAVRVAVSQELATSIFEARTKAKEHQRRYRYALVARTAEFVKSHEVMDVADVDFPLIVR